VLLPSVEKAEIYVDKAGPEILGQMYTFRDKGDRELCLRPEGTATCQLLARQVFKQQKDVAIWYCERCWRYERTQSGRYREFTQFGVEILNPRDFDYWRKELMALAMEMVVSATGENGFELKESVKRGLAYYTDEGFEISCPKLGAQKQVCGGGRYAEGIGFALGIDRLMIV
jgi:histidyl-tRNA synthetase